MQRPRWTIVYHRTTIFPALSSSCVSTVAIGRRALSSFEESIGNHVLFDANDCLSLSHFHTGLHAHAHADPDRRFWVPLGGASFAGRVRSSPPTRPPGTHRASVRTGYVRSTCVLVQGALGAHGVQGAFCSMYLCAWYGYGAIPGSPSAELWPRCARLAAKAEQPSGCPNCHCSPEIWLSPVEVALCRLNPSIVSLSLFSHPSASSPTSVVFFFCLGGHNTV